MKARIVFFPPVLAAALFAAIQPCSAQTATQESATPIAATAPTSVPALVPYSGAAIGANGKPLTGDVAATFLIYKDEQGGEPLFTEAQTVNLDPVGHYKAQLGASLSNGIPISLFASGEARWLEVQIAGEAPQPRVLLVSVPYALKAADAATLGGLPASAFSSLAPRVPLPSFRQSPRIRPPMLPPPVASPVIWRSSRAPAALSIH
jgi:hypothetical protein